MTSRARRAGRGVRLVQVKKTEAVGNRLEAGLLVDGEAADVSGEALMGIFRRRERSSMWHVLDSVHSAAVEHAQAVAVAVERERHGELSLGRHRVPDLLDVGGSGGVDGE